MDYLHKITENTYQDLFWNIPEKKQGSVNVIGGNLQNFRTPTKIAEYIVSKYPIEKVNLVLPDVLKSKLPPLDNLIFLPSTETGSFADGDLLLETYNSGDYNLLVGDFSKNSITGKAVASACKNAAKPLILTRDTLDLLSEEKLERLLMNDSIIMLGSLAQFQKIFRAVYYPKVLLLSQSLVQVADAIHKFTLSYPISIITLHNGQILIARNGNVNVVPLENTDFSPITLWSGEFASKILVMNLFNPNNFIDAATGALFLR